MRKLRKPHSNSPLRMLPEERQEKLISLLNQKSQLEVQKHLAGEGITISLGGLSHFYQWWHLRQQFKRNEDSVNNLMELLRQEQPELSEEKVFNYGQRVFTLLAMENESVADWSRIQRLRQQEQTLKLEERRLVIL